MNAEIDLFRRYFQDFPDQYVLIGGTACMLLLQEEEQDFRVTRDFDIVLIVEALTSDFVRRFWRYIREGGYRHGARSDGTSQTYRFTDPNREGFPKMIELFSRTEGLLHPGQEDAHIAWIPMDGASGLSAILLDDTYYGLIIRGTRNMDGVSVLSTEILILFKIKAWLDNTRRRACGETVQSHDIRKHRNDVIKLAALLAPEARVQISSDIENDLSEFLDALTSNPPDYGSLGFPELTSADISGRLRACYHIVDA